MQATNSKSACTIILITLNNPYLDTKHHHSSPTPCRATNSYPPHPTPHHPTPSRPTPTNPPTPKTLSHPPTTPPETQLPTASPNTGGLGGGAPQWGGPGGRSPPVKSKTSQSHQAHTNLPYSIYINPVLRFPQIPFFNPVLPSLFAPHLPPTPTLLTPYFFHHTKFIHPHCLSAFITTLLCPICLQLSSLVHVLIPPPAYNHSTKPPILIPYSFSMPPHLSPPLITSISMQIVLQIPHTAFKTVLTKSKHIRTYGIRTRALSQFPTV